MIDKNNLVEIGKFQRTHALKGELNAILDIPEEYVRQKGATSYLIKLEGVDTVEDASELVNSPISVPKDVLQEYVGDVMYEDDIEGFKVIDTHFGEIGILEYIDDSTENELMVVKTPEEEEIYIPLVDDFIINIDEGNKEIHTSLPEGLITLNRKEE